MLIMSITTTKQRFLTTPNYNRFSLQNEINQSICKKILNWTRIENPNATYQVYSIKTRGCCNFTVQIKTVKCWQLPIQFPHIMVSTLDSWLEIDKSAFNQCTDQKRLMNSESIQFYIKNTRWKDSFSSWDFDWLWRKNFMKQLFLTTISKINSFFKFFFDIYTQRCKPGLFGWKYHAREYLMPITV